MADTYFYNKTFDGLDYSVNRLSIAEYDQCIFTNCNFAESEISNSTFLECEFINCNMSMNRVKNTSFQEVKFKNCKILGVKFNECNTFLLNISFKSCLLNLSSFYQLKLIATLFDTCKLHEVDFTEANLKGTIFKKCELNNAIFDKTNLQKTDFRTADNYSIEPVYNKLKGAIFSKDGIIGLLEKHQIIIE